jgi:amidase
MKDLVEFMENTKEEETEKFGIDMFTAARDQNHDKNSPDFLEGVKTMKHLGADIERLLDKTGCDVLAMPTSADVPYDLGQNPVISVPLGFYSLERKQSNGRNGMIAKGNNIP